MEAPFNFSGLWIGHSINYLSQIIMGIPRLFVSFAKQMKTFIGAKIESINFRLRK